MKLTEIIKFVLNNDGSALFYTPKIYKSDSYLFKKPLKKLSCSNRLNIKQVFNEIEKLRFKYKGFFTAEYEAGYFFEDKFKDYNEEAYIKAYFFEDKEIDILGYDEIEYDNIKNLLSGSNFTIKNKRLNVSKNEYLNAIYKVKNYIAKGDTYQINYTIKSKLNIEGNLLNLILKLLFNQSAEYICIINDSDKIIISISPELFFETRKKEIIAKPMKGTIKRGFNIDSDVKNSAELYKSRKNRAENVMIVDLLRNDIGKISELNSVFVEKLYEVEKYETVFQMTSTIKGVLLDGKRLYDIFEALYPCGSITGAPKIRTMEIIRELEKESRGIYTGTIGLLGKNVKFNIPIRTLVIDKQSNNAEIGIGSGVVWDSIPEHEFEETNLKSDFLIKSDDYFELFETMLVENGEVFLFDYHIDRIKTSANYFLFLFDEMKARYMVKNQIKKLASWKKYRLKMLLNKWGDIKLELQNYNNDGKKKGIKILLSDKFVYSKNKFQYFKTTNRRIYDYEYKSALDKGFDEVIFLNEKGEVTEGAISNIIIEKSNKLFTPCVSSGLLAGCYRNSMIDKKIVFEKTLFWDDIIKADKIQFVNSIRKIRTVSELYNNRGLIKEYKS